MLVFSEFCGRINAYMRILRKIKKSKRQKLIKTCHSPTTENVICIKTRHGRFIYLYVYHLDRNIRCKRTKLEYFSFLPMKKKQKDKKAKRKNK